MLIIGIVIGLILGSIVTSIIFYRKQSEDGLLIVNTADPEKDIFRFELKDLQDFEKMSKKKFLRIKVISE